MLDFIRYTPTLGAVVWAVVFGLTANKDVWKK